MTNKAVGFRTEAELVRCYSHVIRQAINDQEIDISTKYEVPAPGVIPDLVIYSEQNNTIDYVITVEFKLSNWQRAIQQAFRHRNFGNEAYVILDQTKSRAAINNLERFKKANVGLMTVDASGSLIKWHSPDPALPFSKEFSRAVACSLLSPQEPTLADLLYTRSLEGRAALSQLKSSWSMPTP